MVADIDPAVKKKLTAFNKECAEQIAVVLVETEETLRELRDTARTISRAVGSGGAFTSINKSMTVAHADKIVRDAEARRLHVQRVIGLLCADPKQEG
jgi:hypothetical protein